MTHDECSEASACSLDARAQTRNLWLFAICTGLQYLAAPVGYVGATQASLLDQYETSARVANLPETLYLAVTFSPVLLAWLSPHVRRLKRNLVLCYLATCLSQAAVAVTLFLPFSRETRIAAVIMQGIVAGVATTSAIAFLWEMVARGTSSQRRGLALALAFGAGPVLAALGSLAAQLIVDGRLGGITVSTLEFPWNFGLLYACVAPTMGLAALLSFAFVVPLPKTDVERQPFRESVFGGVVDYWRDSVLRTAAIVTVLVYVGNTISPNLVLFSKVAMGADSSEYVGILNAIRFGFKAVAGFALGWLLARTNPKAGLIATASVYLAAVVLAMVLRGPAYLLVFGVFGAGELIGVYAPNYILSASKPRDIRRNMALATMMMAPPAPAGYLFGAISDSLQERYGPTAGYLASFAACASIILAGILLAAWRLPSHREGLESEGRAEGSST